MMRHTHPDQLPDDLITTAEAAGILDCVPESVRKMARVGRLPVAVFVGRGQRLFRRGSVQAFAEARTLERTR